MLFVKIKPLGISTQFATCLVKPEKQNTAVQLLGPA